MSPQRNQPLDWGTEAKRELGLEPPRWRRKVAVGFLCTVLAGTFNFSRGWLDFSLGLLDGFMNIRELKQSTESDEPLYDVPVIKGPRSTLGSLEPKHENSLPYLQDVLRLRSSKSPATARSLLDEVIENERRTASDDLLSHLYALKGDLLRREGRSTEAISILEKACELNPHSLEMTFLLLKVYKAERYRLESSSIPWPENLDKRIQDLGKKIKELEEKLYPNLQSLLELLKHSSGRIELASGGYYSPTGHGAVTGIALEGHSPLLLALAGNSHGSDLRSWLAHNLPTDGGGHFACGTDSATSYGCDGGGHFPQRTGGATFNSYGGGFNIACASGQDCNVYLAEKWSASIGAICEAGLLLPPDAGSACRRTGAPIHGPDYASTAIVADVTSVVSHEILAIGVNGNPTGDFATVTHAATDAQRVSAALREFDFRSTVLVNHDATKAAILAHLAHVTATSQPDDTFVFYFSGHGFSDTNGHPFLVTGGGGNLVNANTGTADANAIINANGRNGTGVAVNASPVETLALAEVVDVLSHHRGRAVIILDNCLNGMQLNTGAPRRSAAGPNRPTIILAGKPGGQAIESPRLGSGLFTYTLLRFLEQQRTSSELDLDAMFKYTASETARLARDLYGMSQRPQQLVVE